MFGFAFGACYQVNMPTDAELLRAYADEKSEPAFGELVRRHVNLVYSVALRQCGGDAYLAEDVAQRVFTDLARKARPLSGHAVLGGWLYRSTQFAASDVVRAERRRRAREQEAHAMHEISRPESAAGDAEWQKLALVLDQAIGELSAPDRDAVVLRFFEGRRFAEIGATLRLTDDAARMRVERALDKLRALLERRGVTSTSAVLAAALANQAVLAAPAGLVASVTGVALAGAMVVRNAASTGAWAALMSMKKLQVGIAGALALAGTAGFLVETKSNAALRNEVASLRLENAAIATLRASNLKLARASAEVANMRGDDAELARLGEEPAELKTRLQQVTRAERRRPAAAASTEIYAPAQLDLQPRPTFQARPQFPFAMRRAGVGGEVVVDFVISANGEMVNPRALKTTINPKSGGASGDTKAEPFVIAASGVESQPGAVIDGVAVAEWRRRSASRQCRR